MNAIRKATGLILAISLLGQSAAAQQKPAPPSDWAAVEKLKRGTSIAVGLQSGEAIVGRVVKADAQTLHMEAEIPGATGAYTPRDIERAQVRRVLRVKTPGDRRKLLAIGSIAGTIIGIGAGAIYDSQNPGGEDPGLGKLVGGILGFFYGALAGGIAGRIHREKIIYEAPPLAPSHANALKELGHPEPTFFVGSGPM
jgi:hypothetical protein